MVSKAQKKAYKTRIINGEEKKGKDPSQKIKGGNYGLLNREKLADSIAKGDTKLNAGINAGSKGRSKQAIISSVNHRLQHDSLLVELIEDKKKKYIQDLNKAQEKMQGRLIEELNKKGDLSIDQAVKGLTSIYNSLLAIEKSVKHEHKDTNQEKASLQLTQYIKELIVHNS